MTILQNSKAGHHCRPVPAVFIAKSKETKRLNRPVIKNIAKKYY
jgi:hypothetical protein